MSLLNNMKEFEKFDNIIKEAKKTIFAPKEKAQVRLHLTKFLKNQTFNTTLLSESQDSPSKIKASFSFSKKSQAAILPWFFSKPSLRYASLSLALMLFFGSGVAFAAHKALPGDFLYSLKTNVNEKVLGMVVFSDEAKAYYNLGLVQLRLQEIEKITSKNTLDDKKANGVKVLLDSHIKEINHRLKNIENNKKNTIAIEIQSELEASLNGHYQVVDQLSDKKNTTKDEKSRAIDKILFDVKEKSIKVSKERQDYRSKLPIDSNESLKIQYENTLSQTQSKIEAIMHLVSDKKNDIRPEIFEKSQFDLALVAQLISDAKIEFESQKYDNALLLLQNAFIKAREVEIYAESENSLKIKLDSILKNQLNLLDSKKENSDITILEDIDTTNKLPTNLLR